MEQELLKLIAEYQPRERLGFGPDPDFVFDEFQNKPFQPFTRIERNNKCCDFIGKANIQAAHRNQEEEFITVGNNNKTVVTKTHKKTTQKRVQFQPQQQLQQNTQIRSHFDHSSQRRQKFTQAYKRYVVTKKTKFKDSISIQPDWITKHEASRQIIEKTPLSVITFEDLLISGKIRHYNNVYEKVKPNLEKQIPQQFEELVSSSTMEDGYLKSLIEKGNGNEKILTIYTTDKLLLAVLTFKYSVYPWDILVTKKGNQIIFDKAPENKDKLTYLELQPINENTTNDMPEDEKVVLNASEESIIATGNWQLMAIKDRPVNEDFNYGENGKALQSNELAFKYVKCIVKERIEPRVKTEEPKAGEEKMHIIVRTTIDGCDEDGEPILIKGLNECDNSTNWRKQLETSAGQLTSMIYLFNTNNLAKWLCQAQIAGVDRIKIGFLARQQLKDANKHSLLMVETCRYKDIQSIINFRQTENWQNVRYLGEHMSKHEDGQYILLKQAFKPSIRIFRVEATDEEDNNEQ